MKRFLSKARVLLCGLILLSFFLPAYAHYNAVQFISFLLEAVNKAYEITAADAFLAIATLLIIPFSALALIVCSYQRKPVRRIYAAVPLIFFLCFTGLLFTNETGQAGDRAYNYFAAAGPGFYIAGLSCILLLFTKNPRRKRGNHKQPVSTELPVKER